MSRRHAAAVGRTEQVGHGEGDDEGPLGGHDIHLVDAEAQDDMDKHVEGEPGECHPEETAASRRPDARCKEQGDKSLDAVVAPVIVGDYHRTVVLEDILEEDIAVELDGLAKEVFDNARPSVGTAVGPGHKSFLGHGVTNLGIGMVAAVFLLSQTAEYLVDSLLDKSGVVGSGCVGISPIEAVAERLVLCLESGLGGYL